MYLSPPPREPSHEGRCGPCCPPLGPGLAPSWWPSLWLLPLPALPTHSEPLHSLSCGPGAQGSHGLKSGVFGGPRAV